MACLDANEVLEYLRGTALEARRTAVDEHLDGCDDCRALVAAAAPLLASASPPPAPPDGDDEAAPARGARVARYIVRDRLGAGSMGVVYAADDPELHRRVALKLLRPGPGDAIADTRLLREAQALARVSHENVIPVFDVGTHAGQVFLAMELVSGQTLRAWLAARPREPREILDVFVAAGRGLAAAHAAGLVHRDFKPDNVLVGNDGRVRVTDFGLARTAADAPAGASPPSVGDDLLTVDLTHARALVGTPAYMSPERLSGDTADARGDQFSFCVALYEALYGHRPFPATHFAELRSAVLAGRVRAEPGGRVPQSLRSILLRGLSLAPAARFPSVDELLAALTRDRGRGARRLLLIGLAALLLVGSGLIADGIVRARRVREAQSQLEAATHDLDRALALRYQVFVALAKPTSVLPVIREVAGNVDRADFGLGESGADAGRLEELHENLASADWSLWTHEGLFAVADYKGRLVYSSGAPRAFGMDVRALDAVARAYGPESQGVSVMVISGDEPALVGAGLVGAPRPGLVVVLARSAAPGGLPRAVFAQTLDGRQLLDDLNPGPGLQLALVAPDGAAEGPVPPAVVAQAVGRAGVQRSESWLALAHPIGGTDEPTPVARVVLARSLVGQQGLFPYARLVLALLAGLLAAGVLQAGLRARRLV